MIIRAAVQGLLPLANKSEESILATDYIFGLTCWMMTYGTGPFFSKETLFSKEAEISKKIKTTNFSMKLLCGLSRALQSFRNFKKT